MSGDKTYRAFAKILFGLQVLWGWLRRRLVFFGVLLVLTLFLILLQILCGQAIRRSCIDDVALKLHRLQSLSTALLQRREEIGRGSSSANTLLRGSGLGFIRLIRGESEMFLTKNTDLFLRLRQVADGLAEDAIWLSPQGAGTVGDWVVVTRKRSDGSVLQGGAEYPELHALYRSLRRIICGMWFLSLFLAAGIARLVRWKTANSLRQVRDLLEDEHPDLEEAFSGWEPEAVSLFQQIQKVLQQNGLLMKEMQASLDNVAHDLRTPMTRLRSVAEYGLQKNDPERLAEALSDCLEESERVLALLGIMMSVAEAESGTMQLHREEVALRDLVDDVITLYEYVAEEKDISVTLAQLPECLVKVDRTRMLQVFANLMDNAIKYSKPGGRVAVDAQEMERGVTVSFRDNGMGISVSEQSRIWERMFRGDRSRSEQGLGLGLNYVKAVVEAHDGTVTVVSSLGEGATFTVFLPVE